MNRNFEKESAVKVRDLTLKYGTRTILEKVSFDVKQGSCMVVMGGAVVGKAHYSRR